jgi:hypothetical protein
MQSVISSCRRRPGDPTRDHHPITGPLSSTSNEITSDGTGEGPGRDASTVATSCATRGCRSTVIGIQVGGLLGGAVITETVFAWGGVGRFVVEAINNRDYLVVQNTILVFALVFLVVNLIVDILYAFLDPRIRYA